MSRRIARRCSATSSTTASSSARAGATRRSLPARARSPARSAGPAPDAPRRPHRSPPAAVRAARWRALRAPAAPATRAGNRSAPQTAPAARSPFRSAPAPKRARRARSVSSCGAAPAAGLTTAEPSRGGAACNEPVRTYAARSSCGADDVLRPNRAAGPSGSGATRLIDPRPRGRSERVRAALEQAQRRERPRRRARTAAIWAPAPRGHASDAAPPARTWLARAPAFSPDGFRRRLLQLLASHQRQPSPSTSSGVRGSSAIPCSVATTVIAQRPHRACVRAPRRQARSDPARTQTHFAPQTRGPGSTAAQRRPAHARAAARPARQAGARTRRSRSAAMSACAAGA